MFWKVNNWKRCKWWKNKLSIEKKDEFCLHLVVDDLQEKFWKIGVKERRVWVGKWCERQKEEVETQLRRTESVSTCQFCLPAAAYVGVLGYDRRPRRASAHQR